VTGLHVVVCVGHNESAAARRPALAGGGGASKMAAAASANWKYKILTKSKVTQSCDAMTWLFDCNVNRHSTVIIAHAEFVIVNGVML